MRVNGGFKTTADNRKLVKNATDEQIKKALEECGLTAERYAKENAPVDTGNLRNSLTHQTGKRKVLIGSAVKYAPYVELGTGIYAEGGGGRKTPWFYEDEKGVGHLTQGSKPQPYLRPAIADHIDEYNNIIKKNLKG